MSSDDKVAIERIDPDIGSTALLSFMSEDRLSSDDGEGSDKLSLADIVVMSTSKNAKWTENQSSSIRDINRARSIESMKLQKSRYVFTEKVVRSKSGKVRAVGLYNVTEELGRGAFGAVFKVEKTGDDSKTQYAMKVFLENQKTQLLRRCPRGGGGDEGTDSRDSMLREIAIMKRLHHPHLVHLVEIVEETSEPYSIFVVMEYASLGPIMRVRKGKTDSGGAPTFYTPLTDTGSFGEAQASGLMRELVSAMSYLHLNKVAHRDLKPDNVVITGEMHVKIVDFGVSKCFADDSSGSSSDQRDGHGMVNDLQGTWPFWAPEMCSDRDLNDAHFSAYATDVWAAGVVLWVVVFGRLPFYGPTPEDIFTQIRGDMPTPPSRRSPELMSMLTAMLTQDVLSRPDFRQCEKFKWIQDYTTLAIENEMKTALSMVDLTDLDIDDAMKRATTVQLSQVFQEKLRAKVQRIREHLAEKSERRQSVHREDSEQRRLTYLLEGGASGSESFLFDTDVDGEKTRQSIAAVARNSLEGDEEFLGETYVPVAPKQSMSPTDPTQNTMQSSAKSVSSVKGVKCCC